MSLNLPKLQRTGSTNQPQKYREYASNSKKDDAPPVQPLSQSILSIKSVDSQTKSGGSDNNNNPSPLSVRSPTSADERGDDGNEESRISPTRHVANKKKLSFAVPENDNRKNDAAGAAQESAAASATAATSSSPPNEKHDNSNTNNSKVVTITAKDGSTKEVKPSVALADADGVMSCPLCDYADASIVAFKQHSVECRLDHGLDALMPLVVIRRVHNMLDFASPLKSRTLRNISSIQTVTIFSGRHAPKMPTAPPRGDDGSASKNSARNHPAAVLLRKKEAAAAATAQKKKKQKAQKRKQQQGELADDGAAAAAAAAADEALHGLDESEEQQQKNNNTSRPVEEHEKKKEKEIEDGKEKQSESRNSSSRRNSPVVLEQQSASSSRKSSAAATPRSQQRARSPPTAEHHQRNDDDDDDDDDDERKNSSQQNNKSSSSQHQQQQQQQQQQQHHHHHEFKRVVMDLTNVEITRPVAEKLIDVFSQPVSLENLIPGGEHDAPIEELNLKKCKCRTIDVEEVFALAVKRSRSIHILSNLKECAFAKRLRTREIHDVLQRNGERLRTLHEEARFDSRISEIRRLERDTTHSVISLTEDEYEQRSNLVFEEEKDFRAARRALERSCHDTQEAERAAFLREHQRHQRSGIEEKERDDRRRLAATALVGAFSELMLRVESVMRAAIAQLRFETIRDTRTQERVAIFIAKKRQKDRIQREFRERARCEAVEASTRKDLMRSFDVGIEVSRTLRERHYRFVLWREKQSSVRALLTRLETAAREVIEREGQTTMAAIESKFNGDIRSIQVRDATAREKLEDIEMRIRTYYAGKFETLVALRLRECELQIAAMIFADRALGIEMQRLMSLEVLPTVSIASEYTPSVPPPTVMVSPDAIAQPSPVSVAPSFGIDLDMPYDWIVKTADVERRCSRLAQEERIVQSSVLRFLQNEYARILTLEFELFTLPFVEIEHDTGHPAPVVLETIESFRRNAEQDGTVDEMCEMVLRRRCVWCDSMSPTQILKSRLAVRGLLAEIRLDDPENFRDMHSEDFQDQEDYARWMRAFETLRAEPAFEQLVIYIPPELLPHNPIIVADGERVDLEAVLKELESPLFLPSTAARGAGAGAGAAASSSRPATSNFIAFADTSNMANSPAASTAARPGRLRPTFDEPNDEIPFVEESVTVDAVADQDEGGGQTAASGEEGGVVFLDGGVSNNNNKKMASSPSSSPQLPQKSVPVTFSKTLTLKFGVDLEAMDARELSKIDVSALPHIAPTVIRALMQSIKFRVVSAGGLVEDLPLPLVRKIHTSLSFVFESLIVYQGTSSSTTAGQQQYGYGNKAGSNLNKNLLHGGGSDRRLSRRMSSIFNESTSFMSSSNILEKANAKEAGAASGGGGGGGGGAATAGVGSDASCFERREDHQLKYKYEPSVPQQKTPKLYPVKALTTLYVGLAPPIATFAGPNIGQADRKYIERQKDVLRIVPSSMLASLRPLIQMVPAAHDDPNRGLWPWIPHQADNFNNVYVEWTMDGVTASDRLVIKEDLEVRAIAKERETFGIGDIMYNQKTIATCTSGFVQPAMKACAEIEVPNESDRGRVEIWFHPPPPPASSTASHHHHHHHHHHYPNSTGIAGRAVSTTPSSETPPSSPALGNASFHNDNINNAADGIEHNPMISAVAPPPVGGDDQNSHQHHDDRATSAGTNTASLIDAEAMALSTALEPVTEDSIKGILQACAMCVYPANPDMDYFEGVRTITMDFRLGRTGTPCARLQCKIPVECYREPTEIKIAHPIMLVHQPVYGAVPEKLQGDAVYPPVYIPFCEDVVVKNVEAQVIDTGRMLIRLSGEVAPGDGIAFVPNASRFSAVDAVANPPRVVGEGDEDDEDDNNKNDGTNADDEDDDGDGDADKAKTRVIKRDSDGRHRDSDFRSDDDECKFKILPPTSVQSVPLQYEGQVVAYIIRGKIIREWGDEGVGDPDDYRDISFSFPEDCPIEAVRDILRHCVVFTQGAGWNTKNFSWLKRRVVIEASVGRDEREVHLTKEVEIRPTGPLLAVDEKATIISAKESAPPVPLAGGVEIAPEKMTGAVQNFNGGFLIVYVSDGWEPADCITVLCDGDSNAAAAAAPPASPASPAGSSSNPLTADSHFTIRDMVVEAVDEVGGEDDDELSSTTRSQQLNGTLSSSTGTFNSRSRLASAAVAAASSASNKPPLRRRSFSSRAIAGRLSRSNSLIIRPRNAEEVEHHKKVLMRRLKAAARATLAIFGSEASRSKTKEILYKGEVIGHITFCMAGIYIQFFMHEGGVPAVTRTVANQLLKALQFQHQSKDPQHIQKKVTICLSESVAAVFSRAVVAVDIEAVDDVTQILMKNSHLRYSQGPDLFPLFPYGEATLVDPDTDCFNGGFLKVSITHGASKGDELSFKLLTSRIVGPGAQMNLRSHFHDLKYNQNTRMVTDRKGLQIANVVTTYSEEKDCVTDITLKFPRNVKEAVHVDGELAESTNDAFVNKTFKAVIGNVTLSVAAFLLNCIQFSNSYTLDRPRDTKRTLLVRVRDPKNPIDGKAKMHLDVSPPLLAWGTNIYTSNTLWNFDITVPSSMPENVLEGIPVAKNMISYWEYMTFDGTMSVRFQAQTDKGRRVQLSFFIMEKMLPSPLRLVQNGTAICGAKERDAICKVECDGGPTLALVWGPGSGAKEKAITRHFLTAILRAVGIKATNERGGQVSLANGAAINIMVKAYEGNDVKAWLKITADILPQL